MPFVTMPTETKPPAEKIIHCACASRCGTSIKLKENMLYAKQSDGDEISVVLNGQTCYQLIKYLVEMIKENQWETSIHVPAHKT